MRAIFDTNLLIANDVPAVPEEIGISVVSLAELHYGVLAASATQRPLRLRRLASIESRFAALPVDSVVARNYGLLADAITTAGRKPRARNFDLLIAATAMAHNAILYTRNTKDFGGLDSLVDVRPL
ncbi:PIN domain-containing protein [Arthrobacter subterraneus]|uniref:PIN domain-containing protein n=1 Tax=Arthrobacter subterraneus TaxID=335973 RepID=UPI0037FAF063